MQPPSGGCVLKLDLQVRLNNKYGQPPSGGCVLKLMLVLLADFLSEAATFGWLCVET